MSDDEHKVAAFVKRYEYLAIYIAVVSTVAMVASLVN